MKKNIYLKIFTFILAIVAILNLSDLLKISFFKQADAASQVLYMKTTGASTPYPTTSNLYETTAGVVSDVTTFAQNKRSAGVYQFQSGITNTKSFGSTVASLPTNPSGYAWIYTGTNLDNMQTDAGNWTINFKYKVVYTSAPTVKNFWYRVLKVNCNSGACSTVENISPTDASAPANSAWSKYAIGTLPSSNVLSTIQTITFAASAKVWSPGDKIYVEFAIETNTTGSNTGGWYLEAGTSSNSLTTSNVSNAAPTLSISQPNGITVPENSNYDITYNLSDTDNVVTAAFYYDTNNSGYDGVAIPGGCASAAEGSNATCSWNTSGIEPGIYYVYGVANDGVNSPVRAYSGSITINDSPSLSVSQPDGMDDSVFSGATYDIAYTLVDSDNIVTAAFYYDEDNSGFDGTPIAGACASAGEGSGVTCSWNTTGVAPGTYYVHGNVNDGVNAATSSYSTGVLTINSNPPSVSGYTNSETSLNFANCATSGCGARVGQTVTLTGSNLGSGVSNKDSCAAGATNGCIRVGDYTIPAANVTSWSDTQIIFTVPAAVSSFGGSGSACGASGSGVCITQNGQSDAGSVKEFWVFPDITSISPGGAGEAKEGESIIISGNKFDSSQGTVLFQNCAVSELSATVNGWTESSITVVVPNGVDDQDDLCDIKVVRSAGTGSKTDISGDFKLLPEIITVDVCPTCNANADREYDSGVSAYGIIQLSGKHFGASGAVTVLDVAATLHNAAEGACSLPGYTETSACYRIPDVTDSVYTGNITLTRQSDSKVTTFGGFRILPKITNIDPSSSEQGGNVTLNGNHFCQTGICPGSLDSNNKVTFNTGVLADTLNDVWSHTAIPLKVPSSAQSGGVTLTSNSIYLSNSVNFTVLNPVPKDPEALNQFKDNAMNYSISVGGYASATPIYFSMTMESLVAGGTLYPQIEIKPIGQNFECGSGACSSVSEGSGKAGPGPIDCSQFANSCWISTSTVDNSYHWRARVRHNKEGIDYFSNWVSFGGNSDPGATDFVQDTIPASITNIASSTVANSATISWDTAGEQTTSQVQYGENGSFSEDCSINNDCSVLDESLSFNHSVQLDGLASNTIYYFRVRSVDAAGNQAVSDSYNFKTTGAPQMPISGELISAVFDMSNSTSGPAYNSIIWNGVLGGPSFNEGKVRFQLAAADDHLGPWNYLGGALCAGADWYEAAPDVPVKIGCFESLNNKRYLRYKLQICSFDCQTAGTYTPQVDGVIMSWSP